MSFLRQFKYTTISMIRSNEGLFWTILYPILLSSLFFAAVSNIINFSVNKINVGIEEKNPIINEIRFTGMFNIIPTNSENAEQALRNKTIEGFIENDGSLKVSSDGIAQTITKGVLDQLKQTKALNVPISPFDYGKEYVKSINEKQNSIMILFYSLLAMVATYGLFGALSIPAEMQANISKLGARISATPLKRFNAYLAGLIFFALFNFAANFLYIVFVVFVLKVPFIGDIKTTLALLGLANIFGVSLGLCIGSIPFGTENSKTLAGVFAMLFLGFLTGLMGADIKLILDEKIPILNRINPLGLLTDNFYNINILQEYNLVLPFCIVYSSFILLFLTVTFFNSRKVQYDSL
ncbi:ABC transporter permease [Treponema phagedenis]|uniref:ABC transporter permease n=1 Tax=Treponema phagedenis TaxID=162 RepID=UPI0011E77A58|nr:ABC transporter permease [Treponema phagedenis]QEK01636.1 ABC transporter permease [Treponema phagedenis]